MTKQRLYIFVGFPGSGKTTVSKLIADRTGAIHLWVDHERHAKFGTPTHTPEESHILYKDLNARTEALLAEHKSVIFDTNFNFAEDRQKLRDIADKHNTETIVLWVQTPVELAKKRAVHDKILRNGYDQPLPEEYFDEIVHRLEPPAADEKPVIIDATDINKDALYEQLGI